MSDTSTHPVGEAKLPELAAANTDRELWREREGDYYANSILVTAQGGIGINVGGHVVVKSLAEWHALARTPTASIYDEAWREAAARVRKYIEEYEDAPSWGGPTMYPAPPSIADLKAIVSKAPRTAAPTQLDARGEAMMCEGCGTTRTLAAIKAGNSDAISCCPERKMVEARKFWRASFEAPAAPLDEAVVERVVRLTNALRELHAVVRGECPSLLDEDSGGDANLDCEIDELLSLPALSPLTDNDVVRDFGAWKRFEDAIVIEARRLCREGCSDEPCNCRAELDREFRREAIGSLRRAALKEQP